MRIYTFAIGIVSATLAFPIAPRRVWAIDLAPQAASQSDNAAELYRQAIKSMQSVASAAKISDAANEDRLPKNSAAALNQLNEPIALTREAAQMPKCDWGEMGGMQRQLDSLSSLRDLVNLNIVQMRADLQKPITPKVLDDFFSTLTLARNIGRQPLLVTKLVEIGSESVAIKWFARDLPTLDKIPVEEFQARFEMLPKTTFADLMAGEKKFATAEADNQGGLMPTMVKGLDPFYKAVGDAGELSPAEFAKVVDTETAKLKLNPLAGTLGPSFKRAQMNLAKVRAQEEMLKTAVAILSTGDAALAQSKDPYGTGPFTSHKTPGGFELTSALAIDGQSTTLRIGH